MTLGIIWVVCVTASILYSCLAGTTQALTGAVLDGVQASLDFAIGPGMLMCLWCGIFELMHRSGMTTGLSRLLRPLLRRLFPTAATQPEMFAPLCANIAANVLGLGNAATPMGIRAASGMVCWNMPGTDRELARLIVLNTASVQLLPTTIASVRAACGAAVPFDILPAVWLSSLCSVSAGLIALWVLER